MSAKTRSHTDYSVGWVCALPHEQTAAIAMLDERHDNLSKPSTDTNAYTLGYIGHHNIVIACLPKGHVGPNTAATVATQMVQTFPSIKIGLMVGIGGGIPLKVRLGDVVVSTPDGQFPGVVQWDLGKSTERGNFERTGSLNNPPNSLLSALGKLESKHELEGSSIDTFLEQFRKKYPLAAKRYLKSTPLEDILFKPGYLHVRRRPIEADGMDNILDDDGDDDEEDEEREEDCSSCDTSQIVRRKPRSRSMRIHYGLIASGNTAIEDAEFRDRLNDELSGKVLCVEMEASGLMNSFPCIVIRGISDYADSHKNKAWQKHAATVAAAFAKELLGCVQSGDVEGERPIRDILNDVKDELNHMNQTIELGFGDTKTRLDNLAEIHSLQRQNEALIWLSPVDAASMHHDYIKKCEPGTGQSLLASEEFQHWINTLQTTLFCPGIPGAGKTFQTAILVDHLVNKFRGDNTIGLAFFYYRFDRQDAQKPEEVIASLVKQLARKHGSSLEMIGRFYRDHKMTDSRPLFKDLVTLLRDVITSLSRAYVVIDALDECDDNDNSRTTLLNSLFAAQKIGLNIYATSRKIDAIEEMFKGALTRQITPSQHDIFMLLDSRMAQLPSFVRSNASLQDEIKGSIESAIEGMFLLARLCIDSLIGKRSIASVRKSLAELKISHKHANNRSDVLGEAYNKAMERICQQGGDLSKDAMIILAWVVKSKAPLTLDVLQLLLAIDVEASIIDEDNFPTVEHITQACAPLVVIENDTQTARLVHYTIQEYFEEPRNIWMEKSQEIIARTCMSYLSFSKIRSVFGSNEFNYGDGEGFFHTYATEFWAHHAVEASVQGLEVQEIINFLDNNTKSNLWYDSLMQIDLAREGFFDYPEYDLLQTSEQVVALHVAACLGLSDVMAELVSKGYDPDARDKSSRSPLWWAVNNNHVDVAKFLLQRNVDTEAKDNFHYKTPLKLAVERGSVSIVKLLLDNGADVESGDRDEILKLLKPSHHYIFQPSLHARWIQNRIFFKPKDDLRCLTPLALAATSGYDEISALLLAKGAKIELQSRFNPTISSLLIATEERRHSTVDLLLANGAKTNIQNTEGLTALHIATKFNQPTIARSLLASGADTSIRDKKGLTALHTGAKYNNSSIVNLLLTKGSDPNQPSTAELNIRTGAVERIHRGLTALHMATNSNSHIIIEALLMHGVNIEARDEEGFTALHLAVSFNHHNAVESLLRHGADIEARNQEGFTALHLASSAEYDDHKTAGVLLRYGADIEAQSRDGLTALYMASASGHHETVMLLLTRGANIEAVNQDGLTTLHMATIFCHYETVEALLTRGVNKEAQNRDGLTALHIAIVSGHHKTVEVMLTHGADIEARNQDGLTALYMATICCHHETVKTLLANGANKDIRDEEGCTALHIAAKLNQASVAEVLLTHGADIEAKNEDDETPLIIASRHRSQATVDVLIAHGANMAAHDRTGQSVLSWAIASSLWPTVQLLMAKGLAVEQEAAIAVGPMLHFAIGKEDTLLLDWLLKNNADVNYREWRAGLLGPTRGWTPLQKAVARGNSAIVSRLLEVEGIDVDALGGEYNFDALTMAIRNRDKEIAGLLMDSGKVHTAFGRAEFFDFLKKSYC